MPVLEERVSTRGGRRLRYLIGGAGPPLVLCHGFLGSAENFQTWFEELSERRTLVIPDLPGCGLSTPLPVECTSTTLAGAVVGLVEELGIARHDLGGLCLGAGVALDIVRRSPGSVGRLILHTPLLAPEMVRRRFHVQAAVMTAPGVYGAVTWLAYRRTVSDLYKRCVVEGDNVDAEAARMNFENQLRCDPQAVRTWLRETLRRDDRAILARHHEPTLIIAASDDRIVDVVRLHDIAASNPDISLALIDDAGHGWNAEYVRRQLDVLDAFLDGRPLPAAAVAA